MLANNEQKITDNILNHNKWKLTNEIQTVNDTCRRVNRTWHIRWWLMHRQLSYWCWPCLNHNHRDYNLQCSYKHVGREKELKFCAGPGKNFWHIHISSHNTCCILGTHWVYKHQPSKQSFRTAYFASDFAKLFLSWLIAARKLSQNVKRTKPEPTQITASYSQTAYLAASMALEG